MAEVKLVARKDEQRETHEKGAVQGDAQPRTTVTQGGFEDGGDMVALSKDNVSSEDTERKRLDKWNQKSRNKFMKFLEGELDGVAAGPLRTPLVGKDVPKDAVGQHEMGRAALGAANKRKREVQPRETAGDEWFHMPKPTMTPEVEKDLAVLRMRQHLDKGGHYKSLGWKSKHPEYFQVGVVLDSHHDYLSGRLTRRERKPHIKDEFLAPSEIRMRTRKRFHEIQERSQSGRNRKFHLKKRGGFRGKRR
eukprot:Plantae.Rhodophyta-Purpureofilum_apyrenoidigerum.ctg47660.p1 GENE.Plantae.Rhodophyta-Purpureofilum_apyrenoidigerum.ctg47660~~Plantae.Rhodophyta-Purpureofilum_apyrenoidigerum.ctg47660.p1  ORF type:complete len:257 (+),score=50.25 Plantae.Rhodophyta-Purpureofilum_apyrenoidigerum.ctg47660:25-771(+)